MSSSELLSQIQSVYTPLGMPGLVMAAGMDTGGTVPPLLLADISRVQQEMRGLEGLRDLEKQLAELSGNCGSFLDRCSSELQQECALPCPRSHQSRHHPAALLTLSLRLESDSEGRQRYGAQWQAVDSAVAASVQREELDYLRRKFASMSAADADTLRSLREFEVSPGVSVLQQPMSDIETYTKSLTLQKSEGGGSPEHLALKAASDEIEQCVNARAQALEEIKGARRAAT
jgi:hypothetical protein